MMERDHKGYPQRKFAYLSDGPNDHPGLQKALSEKVDNDHFEAVLHLHGLGVVWTVPTNLRVLRLMSAPSGISFASNPQQTARNQTNYQVLVQAVYQDKGFVWTDGKTYKARPIFYRVLTAKRRSWQEQLEDYVQKAAERNHDIIPIGFSLADPGLPEPAPLLNARLFETDLSNQYKALNWPLGTTEHGIVSPEDTPINLSDPNANVFLAFTRLWVEVDTPGTLLILGKKLP